ATSAGAVRSDRREQAGGRRARQERAWSAAGDAGGMVDASLIACPDGEIGGLRWFRRFETSNFYAEEGPGSWWESPVGQTANGADLDERDRNFNAVILAS